MNLAFVAAVLGGTCSRDSRLSGGVSTDSRTLEPDSLFVALRGERYDGHQYIADAIARGAAAIVCERAPENVSVPVFVVPDAEKALAELARAHRETVDCKVIAVTGSNGKTTVKEMIAGILPEPSMATRGNLNNHLGVPLSVLKLTPEHRYAVFELGANHPGEIAFTAHIVRPQVSLINSIAPAHIEGFGSIEGVANAKGEIYAALPSEGAAVVNDDDAFAHHWDAMLGARRVWRFSAAHKADVYAENIHFDANGCAAFTLVSGTEALPVTLQVPGAHSVRNALAAATCCLAADIGLQAIVSGLSRFQGVSGRLATFGGKGQSTIIDDTYNANLSSVLAAIDVLAARAGQRILVLGDMGELGAWAQSHHEQAGEAARSRGIDRLMTCGEFSAFAARAFGTGGAHFTSQSSLVEALLPCLDAQTTVLVKGSRAAGMEKIVRELMG
ncbi:UDP-N-acetylmuramoyl-tripeptide--D-alanyl-D- alani ne ligase [Legionella geestiana]|uniref:UDP-N-acetylmuramoyl-tripeptide--D-alanyl-D-alanine ligase n=1 Tax=Legionella geestiana TaxID=45065 RepID=A0A0W0TZ67_9GAMM|nr:UDP-N-acetylmuramoyl-tripeptide--D-alanyl-D-alanine ligase [Legionella geestiana]KTD00968.1 UDP-N-acetylmuramoyl-tripeptide--D-alanyl-D- alani ne ligase [Legionella geestiana]QBS11997.1 UDP-N-acetylmuramoyl-tripeptide--D-alanyl-D-alanine ligase [Legionella geestiana]STX53286.1 UDP-N-acetylmuramoyl-tripeptide--D-alanyl-D-alanine ligase [Legionella geestiana]